MLKIKVKLIIVGLILLTATNLFAQPLLTGYVRHYLGLRTHEEYDYTINQTTFDLTIDHSRGNGALLVNPYIYHYPEKELDIGLRQAYLDLYFDNLDIRLGKQQIVWGKAEGVFITDVVSPKDMREFLLPDFEEIRIGIPAIKLDYYFGNDTFEFVWIPIFTSTKLPDKNSMWSSELKFPITPTFDYSHKPIENTFENSEIFAKYSLWKSTFDVEFMAGYMWDDEPTMHTEKNYENGQLENIKVIPEHHRLTLGGGSFSTSIEGFVLRGESAYYDGKYFETSDQTITDGVIEQDYFHYLLGIDRTILDIDMSLQFIQQAILEYEEHIQQDEFENMMTIRMNKSYLRETLRLELFSYIGLNDEDALIQAKLFYDFSDGISLTAGANIFIGNEGKFGQFDENDMVYTKATYSF